MSAASIPGDPYAGRTADGHQAPWLRNIPNIQNAAELSKTEYAATEYRTKQISRLFDSAIARHELSAMPIGERLCGTHRALFGDVYDWAGETRLVNLAKRVEPEARAPDSSEVRRFEYIASLGLDPSKLTDSDKHAAKAEFNQLFDRIDRWHKSHLVPPNDRSATAAHLAELTDKVNQLHPFREGNGRTTRELVRQVALENGFRLSLDNIDKTTWCLACNRAHDGDRVLLTNLIESGLTPSRGLDRTIDVEGRKDASREFEAATQLAARADRTSERDLTR